MSDNLRRTLRMCIAAVIAGGITAVSNLMSTYQASGILDQKGILIAALGGALVLLTNLQAGLSEPPKSESREERRDPAPPGADA